MLIDRRSFLAGLGSVGLGSADLLSAGTKTLADPRLIIVLQRGGADGLGILAPTGDPDFFRLRGPLAEDFASEAALGDFTLHAAMSGAERLYRAGQASFAHAVDMSRLGLPHGKLPSAPRPGPWSPPWLSRLRALLPGESARIGFFSAPVSNADTLQARMADLIAADPLLHAEWSKASASSAALCGLIGGRSAQTAALGAEVARRLRDPSGIRIAVVATDGWDTHTYQRCRLATLAGDLDVLIDTMRVGLGSAWAQSLVIVLTEFGRTILPNDRRGTDHGAGALAMVFGGNLAKSQIVSDWPGLRASGSPDGAVVRATTDARATVADALANLYRFDPDEMTRRLFA